MSAIKITLKNAKVLRTALGKNAGNDICLSFEDAKKCAKNQKFIVMGGMIPGITTDAVCAILAEALGAKTLINFSKSAIYDSDPTKNPNAKKYDNLSYEQLISLANKSDKRLAGTNFIFDMLACNIIARSKIQAHFINGSDEKEVLNAITGRPHSGTVVR
jgi:uridylate kinase